MTIGGLKMNDISLFYVDDREIEMFYIKNNKEVEKKVISKEDNTINANLKFGTNGIVNKLLSSEIIGSGIMNNSVTEELIVKTNIYDKISFIIEAYPIKELDKDMEDGMIVGFCEFFVLYRIDSDDNVYEEFDHIDNFSYIINRMRHKECIYTFEMNKLTLSLFGYEVKNPQINSVVLKMQSAKMIKEIHHYSEKIYEYVPFLFNVIGEINIKKNGYMIKPILVWR